MFSNDPEFSDDPEQENKVFRMFMKYDQDGDGQISSEEFTSMMGDLNSSFFSDPEKVAELLGQVDADESGAVDVKELLQWIMGRDYSWDFEGDEMDGVDPLNSVGEEGEEDRLLSYDGDVPEEALATPEYWDAGRGRVYDVPEEVTSALQSLADSCWKKVKTRDREEGSDMPVGMKIVSVQRVQNQALWQKYAEHRYRTGAKRPHKCTQLEKISGQALEFDITDTPLDVGLEKRVNEVYLWHGTSNEGAIGISAEGFDVERAGSGAGIMYGMGAYLAECTSKADEYSKTNEIGTYSMLFCRVVLGEVLHMSVGGDNTHTMINMAITSGSYDSVLGDREASVGTYREFVAYKSAQVYPEYIIQYERLTASADSLPGNVMSTAEDPVVLPDEVLPEKLPKKLVVMLMSPDGIVALFEMNLSKDLQNGTLLFQTPAKIKRGTTLGANSDRSKWQMVMIDDKSILWEVAYEGPIPPTSGWEAVKEDLGGLPITIEYPPDEPPPLRHGYIENVHTGLVLAIAGAKRSRGANVITWSKTGGLEQLWTLTPEGKIKSALNNLVIAVGGYRKNRGQYMVTWNDGGADKFWELTPQGQLENKWSRLCMGIASGQKSRGGKIVQWDKSTYWDKVWKFTEHPKA